MLKSTTQVFKYIYLAWFGGSCYVTLETFWRGYSHWTMFILAAFLFIVLGLLNEIWSWNILTQSIIGAIIATIAEFITGCIVNIWLGWNIWDYSEMWGNVLGQICPAFSLLWIVMSIIAIVLDDVIRWKFFKEEKPHYYLIKNRR